MKNFRQKKLLLGLTLAICLIGSWYLAGQVLAQGTGDLGLSYAQATGLSTQDIRITVAKIIRYALGLLGILAVGICLYAGFLWMTAGGAEDRISDAKAWLRNGVIGLAIILLAFAIVTFIMNVLLQATSEEEPCATPGETQACFYASPSCLAHRTCAANNIWGACTPDNPLDEACDPIYSNFLHVNGYVPNKQAVPIRNVVARVFFDQGVSPATVKPETITVARLRIDLDDDGVEDNDGTKRAEVVTYLQGLTLDQLNSLVAAGEVVPGALVTTEAKVDFMPTDLCPDPYGAPPYNLHCFNSDIAYGVVVTGGSAGVRSVDNKALSCTASKPCANYFITGAVVDIEPPTINLYIPFSGQSIPEKQWLTTLNSESTDDGGVAFVEYTLFDLVGNQLPIRYYQDTGGAVKPLLQVDTDYAPVPMPPDAPTPTYYLSTGAWDTFGFQFITPPPPHVKVKAKAYDYDDHATESNEVEVVLRPEHCFNHFQDSDETAVDCGGAWCGVCDGEDCDKNKNDSVCTPDNFACASGYCNLSDCKCRNLPIITKVDQNNGKPGNFVTIYGKYFGSIAGFGQNVLTNVGFEQTTGSGLPQDWSLSTQVHSSVAVTTAEKRTGQKSVLLHQDSNINYNVCDQELCSNINALPPATTRCVWAGGKCKFINNDVCNPNPEPGYKAVYSQGQTVCWTNTYRSMHAKLTYNVVPLAWQVGERYNIKFYYKGNLSQNVPVAMGYSLGNLTQCTAKAAPYLDASGNCDGTTYNLYQCPDQPNKCCNKANRGSAWEQKDCYPYVSLASIPSGNYSEWTLYSGSFIYTTELQNLKDGNGQLKTEIGLYLNYGNTGTNGSNLYIDDFSIEKLSERGAGVLFTGANGSEIYARFPSEINPACGSTWSDDQIIVMVPTGARNGPVKVINSLGNFDTTNTGPGPVLDNFTVNNIARAGVCKLDPAIGKYGDAVKIIGNQFGVGSGAGDNASFGGVVGSVESGQWTDLLITAQVPNIAPGEVGVKVTVGAEASNGVKFTTAGGGYSTDPVIGGVDPTEGGINQYVTITGNNFGSNRGHVELRDSDDALAWGSDSFPAECTKTWSDRQIIIKIPQKYLDEVTNLELDDYQVVVVRADAKASAPYKYFEVTSALPTPGLCALQPDNGPKSFAPVYAVGENFGSFDNTVSKVRFWGTDAFGAISSWDNRIVKTDVPANADDGVGPVQVVNKDSVRSNKYDFNVGACTQEGCNGYPADVTCDADHLNQYAGLDQCWQCTNQGWSWDITKAGCEQQAGDCCGDGVCRDKTADNPNPCQLGGPKANFSWAYSTGKIRIYPQVVEECNRDLTCSIGVNLPSPSPWTPAWDDQKSWPRACVNSVIMARFTLAMDPTTINSNNIIIKKCLTSSATNPCLTTADQSLNGTLNVESSKEANDTFEFTPATPLEIDTTYQGTIIGEARDGTEVPNSILTDEVRAAAYASGNVGDALQRNYVWTFTTRDSGDKCQIGCVEVTPDPYTARNRGWLEDTDGNPLYHNASASSADNACIMLDLRGTDWDWSADDTSRAEVTNNGYCELSVTTACSANSFCPSDLGLCVVGTEQQVDAKKETSSNNPVLIKATLKIDGILVPEKSDSGRLFIKFPDPEIIAKWPDCQEACVNAQIGAAFSVEMANVASDKVKIYACGTDPLCNTSPVLLNNRDFSYSYYTGELDPGQYASELTLQTANPATNNNLIPNTYYRVVVSGEVSSVDGAPLGKLNYDGFSGVKDNVKDSYYWIFKTKNDANLCSIDRVGVAPSRTRLLIIPGYRLFGAQAFGSADVCSPFGQRLDNYAYAWDWLAVDQLNVPPYVPVATISSLSGCTNGVLEIGESCDFGLVNNLFGCSIACRLIGSTPVPPVSNGTCGNGVINSGEQCDYGLLTNPAWARNYCNTTACLLLGNTNYGMSICGNGKIDRSEDCDDGTEPNGGDSDGCTNNCLTSGTVSGSATCGDGQIGLGEECETCWNGDASQTINSGSCAGSDLTTGHTVASGDGCSSVCLNEGNNNYTGTTPPICGNLLVETGEDCDDGNTTNGDGCSSVCLNEGNSNYNQSVCGNNIVEAGEECEDGNTVNGDTCTDHCLNAGSVTNSLIAGPFQTATSVNEGVSIVLAKAGGYCSGNTGLSCARDIDCNGNGYCLLTSQKSGQGELTVVCGLAACPDPVYGLDDAGCCRLRPHVLPETLVPANGATNVCRNAAVHVDFDTIMNPASFVSNTALEYEYTGTGACPGSVAYLNNKSWQNKLFGQGSLIGQLYHSAVKVINYFFGQEVIAAVSWCPVQSNYYTLDLDVTDDGVPDRSRLYLALLEALPENNLIRATVKGGVTNKHGVALGDDYQWTFTTGPDVCQITGVVIDPTEKTLTQVGEPYSLLSSVLAEGNQEIAPIPGVYSWDWLWTLNNTAIAELTHGKHCAISRTTDCTTSATLCASPGDTCLFDAQQGATAKNKNGDGVINSALVIKEDILSNTVGQSFSADSALAVFICDNSWPSVCRTSAGDLTNRICDEDVDCQTGETCSFSVNNFRDQNPSLVSEFNSGSNTNFKTFYCRDAGVSSLCRTSAGVMTDQTCGDDADCQTGVCHTSAGDSTNRACVVADTDCQTDETCVIGGTCVDGKPDDLPALAFPPFVITTPPPLIGANLLRHVLLPRSTNSNVSVQSAVGSNDAIVISVEKNLEHLSPSLWFSGRFSGGKPTSVKIKGYEAVQQGNTIYVNAGNTRPFSPAYTNIYIFSQNDGSSSITQNIFQQLMDNLSFNTNIVGDNYCKIGAVPLTDAVGTIACSKDFDCYRCNNDINVLCESDADCPGSNCNKDAVYCDNKYDKIVRNVKRASDIHDIRAVLANYYQQKKSYPKLESGTYVKNISYSVWPSWRSALGNELGRTLPEDPINQFNGCVAPYNKATCWDNKTLRFACPAQSYSYLYQSDGVAAEVFVNFENYSDIELFTFGDVNQYEQTVTSTCSNFSGYSLNDTDQDGVPDFMDNCLVKDNGYTTVCPAGSAPGAACCPFSDITKCCSYTTPADITKYCNQADADADDVGDACDVCPSDKGNNPDGDGICSRYDNCWTVANPQQTDSDSNCPSKPYALNATDPVCGDACQSNCFGTDLDDCQSKCFSFSMPVCPPGSCSPNCCGIGCSNQCVADANCATGTCSWKGLGGASNCCGDDPGEAIGNSEVCGDNIDNNCNGLVDEKINADGDGYFTCSSPLDCNDNPANDPAVCNPQSTIDCSQSQFAVCAKCINPGATDVCGDGIDSNCDGAVDTCALRIFDFGSGNDDSFYYVLKASSGNSIIKQGICFASDDSVRNGVPYGGTYPAGVLGKCCDIDNTNCQTTYGTLAIPQLAPGANAYRLIVYPSTPIYSLGSLGLITSNQVRVESVDSNCGQTAFDSATSHPHCNINPITDTWGMANGTNCVKVNSAQSGYSPLWGISINGGKLINPDQNQRTCLGGMLSTDTYRPFAIDKGLDYDGAGRTVNPGNDLGSEDITTPIPGSTGFSPQAVYDPDISITFNLSVCTGTCQ